jgi:NAD(P)-dependent dehydrogenase (short-subunit alcohol dehydrogenase family)
LNRDADARSKIHGIIWRALDALTRRLFSSMGWDQFPVDFGLEKLHLTPYLGEPEDIAAMALFLASDEARFVTGQCISVDGGFMASLPHVPMIREMLTAPAKSPS